MDERAIDRRYGVALVRHDVVQPYPDALDVKRPISSGKNGDLPGIQDEHATFASGNRRGPQQSLGAICSLHVDGDLRDRASPVRAVRVDLLVVLAIAIAGA